MSCDLLAQHVPHLRQPVGPVVALDVDLDDRQARPGVGVDVLQFHHLLELGFDPVGDLQFDLLGAGSRVGGRDHRGLDRELRVLQLPELEVAEHPARQDQQDAEVGDGSLFDRKGGKVHGATGSLPGESSLADPRGANARRP